MKTYTTHITTPPTTDLKGFAKSKPTCYNNHTDKPYTFLPPIPTGPFTLW